DGGAIARDPGRDRMALSHVDVLVAGADVIHPRGGRGMDEVRPELPRRAEDEQSLRGRHRPVIREVYRSWPWTATPKPQTRAPHPTGAPPCAASRRGVARTPTGRPRYLQPPRRRPTPARSTD